jgi:hypothetical protein
VQAADAVLLLSGAECSLDAPAHALLSLLRLQVGFCHRVSREDVVTGVLGVHQQTVKPMGITSTLCSRRRSCWQLLYSPQGCE